jgi:hypothetical protein
MTTPVPSRSNRPTARAAGDGYTHRTWLDEMAVALGHVAGIYRDFTVMAATLEQVRAGRTQTNLVDGCEVGAMVIMRAGVQFVDSTDRRYMPVFEAIQQAGGHAEVAQDKRYHDRA